MTQKELVANMNVRLTDLENSVKEILLYINRDKENKVEHEVGINLGKKIPNDDMDTIHHMFLNLIDSVKDIKTNINYINSSVGVIRNQLNMEDIKSVVNTPQEVKEVVKEKVVSTTVNKTDTNNTEVIPVRNIPCSVIASIRNSSKTIDELCIFHNLPESTIIKILEGKIYKHCK